MEHEKNFKNFFVSQKSQSDFLGCQKEQNKEKCNCSYPSCSRKGICCECLRYHLSNRQLPACCFTGDLAKTHERSFEKFAELVKNNKI